MVKYFYNGFFKKLLVFDQGGITVYEEIEKLEDKTSEKKETLSVIKKWGEYIPKTKQKKGKNGRLSPEQKEELMKVIVRGEEKDKNIAKRFGVSIGTIFNYKKKVLRLEEPPREKTGNDDDFKVTPEIKEEIKQYLSEGLGSSEIAEIYAISTKIANYAIAEAKGIKLPR